MSWWDKPIYTTTWGEYLIILAIVLGILGLGYLIACVIGKWRKHG